MLQPGTPIGRYEIQRRLGRGGMGTVYAAHDPVLGRMVAIKLFASELDLPDAAERFIREARSAASLNHANIVTVFDFGDYSSQPYIVMEYIQGETLAEVIRRRAHFPLTEKLRWLEELCAGVAYAHRGGIIHRDIKPTNLIVDRSGRLKVLDFGIARMLGRMSSGNTGLIGTPGYMAPEQILGGVADARSDLFSVAVVGYELLAYAEAFPGETAPAITHRILSVEPAPLPQLVPDIHPELAAVIEQGMAKDPGTRLASVDILRETVVRIRRELEQLGGEDLGATVLRPRPSTRTDLGAQPKFASNQAAVGALTPPPSRPSTDREALASRRRAQIDGALEQARAFLARGELDAALEACVQALTLDDTHAGAIELEQAVQAAIALQRAGALLEEARDELGRGALTGAQELLHQARALDPDGIGVRRLERDLRLARVEQERIRQRIEAAQAAAAAAEQALQQGDLEAALASARQALDLDPNLATARAVEVEALRRFDEEVGSEDTIETSVGADVAPTMLTPLVRPVPAPPPATMLVPVVAPVQRARMSPRSMAAAAVIGLVGLAAVIAVLLRGAGAGATGSVVLDAVPWANVAAIEAADGSHPTLPSPAATPMSLSLPAGTYRVRLVGPPPESESRLITVDVQANGVTSVPTQKFRMLTPEDYFEPYLASSAAVPDAATQTPASPAAPAGAGSARGVLR